MIEFTIHAENIRDLKAQMEGILKDLSESASIAEVPLASRAVKVEELVSKVEKISEPPTWLLEEDKVEEPKVQEPSAPVEENEQSIDDCRIAYFTARERGISNEQIKNLLASLGVERISALPKDKRGQFVIRLSELKVM